MKPLDHISTKVDKTESEGWANRGSFSSSTSGGPLFRKIIWINRQTITHLSVSRISGADNKEADAASRLTHIPVPSFLNHFNCSCMQPKHWRLRLFPSSVKHRLCKMMHTKWSPQESPIPRSVKTAQHWYIGNNYAPSCVSPHTSKESMIQYVSWKYLLNTYAHKYKHPVDRPFQSKAWRNTSSPWGKCLRQRGANISDTTPGEASTVV